MKMLLKKNIETRPFFLPMNKQKIFKKMKLFNKIKHQIQSICQKMVFIFLQVSVQRINKSFCN